jgi:aspartyl-tRNA synthetase
MRHTDLTELCIEHGGGGVPFFASIAEKFSNGVYRRDLPAEIVKAFVVPASANFARADGDKLEQLAKSMGAGGLARAKVAADGSWTQSPLAKTVTPEMRLAINRAVGAKEGDLICFQFGKTSLVHTVLANLRVHVAKRMGVIPESGHGGAWSSCGSSIRPSSNTTRTRSAGPPRIRVLDDQVDWIKRIGSALLPLRSRLERLRASGGSIRLHDPVVQERCFSARHRRGRSAGEVRPAQGAPLRRSPHNGIALGMDRLMMLLAGPCGT